MNTQQPRPVSAIDRSPSFIVRVTLLVVTAIACLLASALHAGLALDLGPLALAEPPIPPAAVVEGIIGLLLAASAVAQATRQRWARQLTVNAYIVGVAGFLLGVSIVARDPGIQTPFNLAVHLGVLPLLIVGLALELLAWRADGRRALHA